METSEADTQFNTSSIYRVPSGYTAWEISNDYPRPHDGVLPPSGQLPNDPTSWLEVDFKTKPYRYLQLIKEYFLEGMIESDFVPQRNQVCWYSDHDTRATMMVGIAE
jgi:hypothetical protein